MTRVADLDLDARTTIRFRVEAESGSATLDGSMFAYATSPWSWNLAVLYATRVLACKRICVLRAEWLPWWLRDRIPRYASSPASSPAGSVTFDLRFFSDLELEALRKFMSRRAAACIARQALDPAAARDAPLALRVSELAHLMVLYRVHVETLLVDLRDLLALTPGSERDRVFLRHAAEILRGMRFVHRPVFHFMYCILTFVCLFTEKA